MNPIISNTRDTCRIAFSICVSVWLCASLSLFSLFRVEVLSGWMEKEREREKEKKIVGGAAENRNTSKEFLKELLERMCRTPGELDENPEQFSLVKRIFGEDVILFSV